jgi:integrase
VVDLRSLGHGQRYTLGPAALGREAALHAAYETLDRLRGRGLADAPQRTMFDDGAPVYVGALLDRWYMEKRYGSAGAARYGKTYTRVVRCELGEYKLTDFAPPAGNARLAAYVGSLIANGNAGRTIRNKLSTIEQALRLAVERGWLAAMPLHPRELPQKAPPSFHWITDKMFRALRSEVLRCASFSQLRRSIGKKPTTDDLALYVERRRMYLSWLFYTGCHHHDADHATADWLFLDGRAYIRHNNKSAACVPDEQFEMPEPLYEDLRALERLQGRPFYPGESFTGGPWLNVSRALQDAAKALQFPHGVNPSILRRSYAREMILRGYTIQEVSDRMGHADQRMLIEIYHRTPRPSGHPRSRWTLQSSAPTGAPPSGLATVLRLQKGES